MANANGWCVHRTTLLALWASVLMVSCAEQHPNPVLAGQDIRVTFLHTSDIHSRLIPYDMTVLASDRRLGLRQENAPFGGIARMAHIIQRERQRNERVAYVDSGDCFQGAPIFNVFFGEIEQRAMSQLRPDAVVIGNHEFDEGLWNYVEKLKDWASYPVIAANYAYTPDNPLQDLSRPYHLANIGGLRIAFIGIANFSSISSITDTGNSLKILPLENKTILQEYLDFLAPHADLLVGVSHAGLGEDEEIIEATSGFDIIFGGHLHVALDPPKIIHDKTGRAVPLVHSGAFAKYVGKLDVVVRDGEVINHKYELIPIDSTVPEDPKMLELMEPYKLVLNQHIDLTSVFGYASRIIRRFGFGGGDAPLGNLVAEAIRFQARADFGMTNTLGIRSDISEGVITFDGLFNVFPFNNTVTTMFVSGVDIQGLFDYVARRSAGRGCNSQVQVSGIEFTMNCNAASPECPDCPRAEGVALVSCADPQIEDKTGCTREPIQLSGIYEMATNDYIAGGGSGFTILRSNNTQFDTGLPIRDAVMEAFVRSPKCLEECETADGRIEIGSCSTFLGCVDSITEFHDRACRKLDSTDLEKRVSSYCGHDDMRCEVTEDCLKADELCADGSCQTCKHSAECDPELCEGDTCRCVDGLCLPDRMRCLNGRCGLKCALDEDCPNFLSTGERLTLCIDGACVPRPAIACLETNDCNPSVLMCFGGGAPCEAAADCAPGESCVDRRCAPVPAACERSDQCGNGDVCRFGFCRAQKGCEDCNGRCVDGLCQETCSPCQLDDQCPSGESCVRNLCVPVIAQCEENRCRTACTGKQGGISECPAANTCNKGVCKPDPCLKPTASETLCRIKNQSLNTERCLTMTCPRASSDGRIKTILPENLEDLPQDLNPDDIE